MFYSKNCSLITDSNLGNVNINLENRIQHSVSRFFQQTHLQLYPSGLFFCKQRWSHPLCFHSKISEIPGWPSVDYKYFPPACRYLPAYTWYYFLCCFMTAGFPTVRIEGQRTLKSSRRRGRRPRTKGLECQVPPPGCLIFPKAW